MSEKIVNDFSITVGTVNGSGSQTANTTILRSLFKMGIPVSGKNMFPSNIQGLPTWYTIRVNKDGFTARREEHEIVVCMNAQSFSQDLADVIPGGAFFYDDSIKLDVTRDDIIPYAMPVKEIMREQKDVPIELEGSGCQHGLCRHPGTNDWDRSGKNQGCPGISLQRQTKTN